LESIPGLHKRLKIRALDSQGKGDGEAIKIGREEEREDLRKDNRKEKSTSISKSDVKK
jgi:hypothetical protein